jgi:glycosyltransferase involved in cell wall biosynthesis
MEMMANGKTVICIANPHLEPLINEKTALIVPIEHEDIATNARHIDRKILQSQMNCYLEDKELCKKIRAQASLTISMLHDKLCTGATADLVMTMTDKLLKKRAQVHKSKKGSVSKPLKILFLNRKDIFENPDTDTSVMEQTRINLEGRGHKVTVCAGYPDEVSQYDIVHGFNSAYSVYTDAFVERAVHEGIPFVVTALQDDFPRYMNKAIMTYRLFEKYIDMGQPDNFFDKQYEMVRKQDPAQFLTSPLALSHAAAVLVSGNEEAAVIKKYFPSARIKVGPVGHFFKKMTVDPQLFINKYKINDFVLCVSPFELKKNQLMLLKALENDNIPVVFVGEGGKYNISYIQLCKSFKRKAQTLFVDSLSEEMLSSAFAAAKVHCLPSWYELPGIVTVKAASYGCQVVQSSWGTINDYCRDRIITCEPDDYHSIRNAVLEALSKGRNKVEGQSINNINWERSTDFIVDTYKYALESGNNCDEPERASNDNASIQAMMDPGRLIEEVTKLVENSKFQDAVLLYETNRPHVVNIPELVKFDELMKKVKMHVKIHC